MKRALLIAGGLVAFLAADCALYLLAWPIPMEPEAWDAPVFDQAAWTPTGTLVDAQRVAIDGHGPEDVEVDAEGRVFAGLHDGRILRWSPDLAGVTTLVNTGGRPLGLHWGLDGRLLVADAHAGLLAVDPDSGAVEVLATACGGRPLVFTDDLDVAADGTIWFSDASERFTQPDWRWDIMENRPNGRLCAWDPATGEAREALPGLYFANGVAVDPDQQFVLVNETSRYRVRKLWLDGPSKGQVEILVDNLPGFPDGISAGTGGRYWIALPSPRNPMVDGASDKPWMRSMMMRAPSPLQPKPAHDAHALAIDASGRVMHHLYDPTGTAINMVTSVQERDGWVYLGSLRDEAWARIPTP